MTGLDDGADSFFGYKPEDYEEPSDALFGKKPKDYEDKTGTTHSGGGYADFFREQREKEKKSEYISEDDFNKANDALEKRLKGLEASIQSDIYDPPKNIFNPSIDDLVNPEKPYGEKMAEILNIRDQIQTLNDQREWSKKYETVFGLEDVCADLNDSKVKDVISQVLDPENVNGIFIDYTSSEIIDIPDIYTSVDLHNEEVASYKEKADKLDAFQSFGFSLLLGGGDSPVDFGTIYDFIDTVNEIAQPDTEKLSYAELVAPDRQYLKYNIKYTESGVNTNVMTHDVTVMLELDSTGKPKKPYHIYAYDRTMFSPYSGERELSSYNWFLEFYEYGKAK